MNITTVHNDHDNLDLCLLVTNLDMHSEFCRLKEEGKELDGLLNLIHWLYVCSNLQRKMGWALGLCLEL